MNVKLPVGNIKDFRYVLMWMFTQVYKEFKEWTPSFHMILIGTANSKSLDLKKSKVVEAKKAGDKPKPTLLRAPCADVFIMKRAPALRQATSMLTGPLPPILVPLDMHYL